MGPQPQDASSCLRRINVKAFYAAGKMFGRSALHALALCRCSIPAPGERDACLCHCFAVFAAPCIEFGTGSSRLVLFDAAGTKLAQFDQADAD